jgi:hypothetical protein
VRKATTLLALILVLAGCSKPLPPEKLSYAGDWRESNVRLLITEDGSVSYKRRSGSTTTTIDAPIKEFQGNNVVVGLGPISTTFVVSEVPHMDGEEWVMVVDGVKLKRKGRSTGADVE